MLRVPYYKVSWHSTKEEISTRQDSNSHCSFIPKLKQAIQNQQLRQQNKYLLKQKVTERLSKLPIFHQQEVSQCFKMLLHIQFHKVVINYCFVHKRNTKNKNKENVFFLQATPSLLLTFRCGYMRLMLQYLTLTSKTGWYSHKQKKWNK